MRSKKSYTLFRAQHSKSLKIPWHHYNLCHSSIYKHSLHTKKEPENNIKFEIKELHIQNFIREIR